LPRGYQIGFAKCLGELTLRHRSAAALKPQALIAERPIVLPA
jgi:hypothetical protein